MKDFSSIIVAIISAITTVSAAVFTGIMAKKIENKNLAFQSELQNAELIQREKLGKQQIDANLKAQARIQWIQEVRKQTLEVIKWEYAKMKGGYQLKKALDMLSLYFVNNPLDGSEEAENSSPEDIIKKIKKLEESNSENDKNKGKNYLIDLYLQKIKKEVQDKGGKYDELEKHLTDLQMVISVYLKHEWDKAKEGK